MNPDGLRVLDPACGDGRFLVAAATRIRRRFGTVPDGCLHGIDVDPVAADAARAALGAVGSVRIGDALSRPGAGSYDVVIGNPPFLNQLATATRRSGRSAWGGGPYADTAALFLALALRAARPDGGRVGLVLPQSILATRDAAPIRVQALELARLDAVWWTHERVFDAEVRTCAVAFVRGERQGGVRRTLGVAFEPCAAIAAPDLATRSTWGHLVADVAGIPAVELGSGATLGSLAASASDFRDQYYGLKDAVDDTGEGPPLVTVGLIDAGAVAWGERPARFARRTFRAPRVALERLPDGLRAWAASRLVPKVVVATQTPVIEAAVDADGAWLPSVPVISVVPVDGADLWRVGAVLCAPAATAWAAATCFGAALSANAIKLSAGQVRAIPLPSRPWDAAAAALACGDLDGCARGMDEAYGTDLFEWWRGRFSSRRR